MFSPEAPRRVPGIDLGPILGGFGRYFSVFFTLFLMCFGLSFGIAFYMGCVWNVYEVGMAYALILDEYYTFVSYSMSVVEAARSAAEHHWRRRDHGHHYGRCFIVA